MMVELENQELTEEDFILKLNDQLLSIGASSAEQSFGLAVWLGTLPILSIVAILLAFKIVNIILAFFLVILFFLVFVAATSILTNKARQNAIRRTILEKSIHQIRTYQESQAIDFEIFYSKAREILPAGAPLMQALDRMRKPMESDQTHE